MKNCFKNLKCLVFVFLFNVFLCSITYGAVEIVIREVSGTGSTLEIAISNALIEATQQVNGMELQAVQELKNEVSKLTTQTLEEKDVKKTLEKSMNTEVLTKAKGFVKSYNVLQSHQVEDGTWDALLRVEILVYAPLGQDRSSMRTMAIFPFRIGFGFSKQKDSRMLSEFSRQLNQKVISEMTQARKFRVVEREYLDELYTEKQILSSGDVPVTEMVRLGQKLGADYIVVGTIAEYKITKEYCGITAVKRNVSLVLDYRVIEVAPQEIRWSNTYRFFGDCDALKGLSGDSSAIYLALFDKAAASIVSEILNVIYPVKVMSVASPSEIILNQGGIRIKENDLFEVYTSGQEIVDPDTGVPIQVDGPKVGTIEVVKVLPKYSIGRIMEGEFNKISTNAVCRPQKAVQTATGQVKRP